MRCCLAVAESATNIDFLTALAPGMVELARMLSFSSKREDGAGDCNSAF